MPPTLSWEAWLTVTHSPSLCQLGLVPGRQRVLAPAASWASIGNSCGSSGPWGGRAASPGHSSPPLHPQEPRASEQRASKDQTLHHHPQWTSEQTQTPKAMSEPPTHPDFSALHKAHTCVCTYTQTQTGPTWKHRHSPSDPHAESKTLTASPTLCTDPPWVRLASEMLGPPSRALSTSFLGAYPPLSRPHRPLLQRSEDRVQGDPSPGGGGTAMGGSLELGILGWWGGGEGQGPDGRVCPHLQRQPGLTTQTPTWGQFLPARAFRSRSRDPPSTCPSTTWASVF